MQLVNIDGLEFLVAAGIAAGADEFYLIDVHSIVLAVEGDDGQFKQLSNPMAQSGQ